MHNDHLPGHPIYRGPMTEDNFTQVHNLLLRGQVIHTKYVGVWGYISSHEEGWKLTESKIQRDLGVGRDFVRGALRAFESAYCLIRTQSRTGSGTFSESEPWFITDLPLQLRQLGVFEEDVIRSKTNEAFEQWRADWMASNDGQNPRSSTADGKSVDGDATADGFTVDGFTVDGESATKKTKVQEDQGSEKTNSSSSSPHDSAATDSAGLAEEEEEALTLPSNETIEVRTAAGDTREQALAKFWGRLPNKATPNSRHRPTVEEEIWQLLTPLDTWGDTEDGPARLAARIEREIPPEGVKSAVPWLRNRLAAAVGGPDETDESVTSEHDVSNTASEAEKQRAHEEKIDRKIREMARGARPAGSGPAPGEHESPF